MFAGLAALIYIDIVHVLIMITILWHSICLLAGLAAVIYIDVVHLVGIMITIS
jgi:hypothetical protein